LTVFLRYRVGTTSELSNDIAVTDSDRESVSRILGALPSQGPRFPFRFVPTFASFRILVLVSGRQPMFAKEGAKAAEAVSNSAMNRARKRKSVGEEHVATERTITLGVWCGVLF
jgi:hypothetical protein